MNHDKDCFDGSAARPLRGRAAAVVASVIAGLLVLGAVLATLQIRNNATARADRPSSHEHSEPARGSVPSDWLAIPSGDPLDGSGHPTVTSEIAALQAAGFQAVREYSPPRGDGASVTTVPAIGTPARRGSTVLVWDHGPVASSATLTGQLAWTGGPESGRAMPHRGTIHVVSKNGSFDQFVETNDDGGWVIFLPPGSYRVLATSPGYGSTSGDVDACSAEKPVTVAAAGQAAVDVLCQIR